MNSDQDLDSLLDHHRSLRQAMPSAWNAFFCEFRRAPASAASGDARYSDRAKRPRHRAHGWRQDRSGSGSGVRATCSPSLDRTKRVGHHADASTRQRSLRSGCTDHSTRCEFGSAEKLRITACRMKSKTRYCLPRQSPSSPSWHFAVRASNECKLSS